MRSLGLFSLLIGLTLLAGCANTPAVKDGYHPELVSAYHLDAGDRVRVIVYGQTDLSNTYVVDQAGNLSMPLIGTLPARGRSTAEIETDIAHRLRKGYVRNPDVSVEIDRYRPFFAMGEVTAAGQYPYVPGMTVQQAVAIAGGFTPRANAHAVQVTRSADGQIGTAMLALDDAILPGDTIYVRERHF
jgi:polysaccharide export outer membrane protein